MTAGINLNHFRKTKKQPKKFLWLLAFGCGMVAEKMGGGAMR